jgi:hypothetical protein
MSHKHDWLHDAQQKKDVCGFCGILSPCWCKAWEKGIPSQPGKEARR